MRRFYSRAIKDILDHRFLTAITVITIALSIMIASAFALFFVNAGDMLRLWQKGIRMMVYLAPDTSEAARLDTKFRLQAIADVQEAHYISKEEALARLKGQMQQHASLLENLHDNPLPEAFEVILQPGARDSESMRFLAEHIEALPAVTEVEYGQQWIGRFTGIINLFSLAGTPWAYCFSPPPCSSWPTPSAWYCTRGGTKSQLCAWWAPPTASSRSLSFYRA